MYVVPSSRRGPLRYTALTFHSLCSSSSPIPCTTPCDIVTTITCYAAGTPLTFHSVSGTIVVITTSYIYLGYANKIVSPERKPCTGLQALWPGARRFQVIGEEGEAATTRLPLARTIAFIVISVLAIAGFVAGLALRPQASD